MTKKYSGKEIIRAGEIFIENDILEDQEKFDKAFKVLSYWRFSHEKPLETAFYLLQKVTTKKDRSAIFAKRLKRYISIIFKLKRFSGMKLKNMQDIGGCRAIVSNEKKAQQIIRELKKHKEFIAESGRKRFKDYIKTPKYDGYRGYHLIGKFDADDGDKKNIEIQIRTRLQHDWATTVEIVDLFTDQALKSNQGDDNWKDFFYGISEQFALMDKIHLFESRNLDEKFKLYQKQFYSNVEKKPTLIESIAKTAVRAAQLDVIKLLEAYANSLNIADSHIEKKQLDGYVLLEVNTKESAVYSTFFRKEDSSEAEKLYVEAEKKSASKEELVVALVSTTAVGDIKKAYPNYFADSTDFLEHLALVLSLAVKIKKNSTST